MNNIDEGLRGVEFTDAMLRDLLNVAPDALLVVAPDGRIVLVNDAVEDVVGWPREELLGQPVEVLVPRLQRAEHARHREHYAASPATRPMGMGMQLTAVRKDGTEFPAEISLSSVDHGAAGPVVLAAIRDITERVAEAERAQQRRAESQRMASLGQLAGAIAHDFNNLLGVILNYTTLATRHIDDPDVVADLDEIRAAAELGAGLTKQLLTFARREAVLREVIDVSAAVREAAWLLQRTVGSDIDVVLELTESGATASFGHGQLEQILLNLALNSRAAMPDGGVLTVRVCESGPDDLPRTVTVSVTDTGVGMTADVAARAFEPLFSTKPLGQGTGLGLASVHDIVQRSEGRTEIRSAPGEGTTVTIVLPYAPAAARPRRLSVGPQGGEHILLVEDDDAVRAATARFLIYSGYHVIEAEDGRHALDLLEEGIPVDLIVTDVAMPRLRGDQLAAQVDAHWPQLPLIYLTGKFSGIPALDRPTLTKPVAAAELLSMVRTVLDA